MTDDPVDKVIADWKDQDGQLLMLLSEIQSIVGYVSDGAIKKVAAALKLPRARIYEVLTFYRDFRLSPPKSLTISICIGTGCYLKGGRALFKEFESALAGTAPPIRDQVTIVPAGCLGGCGNGPLVKLDALGFSPVVYSDVNSELVVSIVDDHICPLLSIGPEAGLDFELPPHLQCRTQVDSLAMCKCPQLTVLCEAMDSRRESEGVDHNHRYDMLKKVVTNLYPQQVIDQIRVSGLRGRGGGGFPTAEKFQHAYNQKAEQAYVICNADEGDPGGFIARYLLENNPETVIEGMAIAAFAIGADTGWFYIRSDYHAAVERVEEALVRARAGGFLGRSVFGTDFSFDCKVRIGAGAFVCGEETALIASIEGRRGIAKPRPPYPTESGLWGKPTCVNNIETLATLPGILRIGAEEYSNLGTKDSPGTKLVALTGNIQNTGIAEVPMGMPLNTIVEKLGGGTKDGAAIKAVHTGGPSGGVIPASALSTPLCYTAFQENGFFMGDGAISVLSENDDMVDLAAYFMEFSVNESCGRCAACRIGGRQVLDLLKKILAGNGTLEDLVAIKRICTGMQKASLCGLGQSAPNPMLSTLKFFENEYLVKLVDMETPS